MTNVKRALEVLEEVKKEYSEAINHDEQILLSTFFYSIRKILQALDGPDQSSDTFMINKRLGEIESQVCGAKKGKLASLGENKWNPKEFQEDLTNLINKHCVENACDMPDFLLAEMIVKFIQSCGEQIKKNLDWHGCDSVCHPKN
jgi:hypothetical protein